MSGVVQMIARTTHHQTCTSNRAVGSIDSRVLSSVLKLFALVLLFVGTMGQENARPAGAGDSASAATTHIISPPATALTAFGIRLLKEMAPDDETVGDNVFISPWSIFTSMAMVNAGITPAEEQTTSPLAAQFQHVMGGLDVSKNATLDAMRQLSDSLVADMDGPVNMVAANSIWTRDGGLKPEYVAAMEEHFDAKAGKLPEKAAPVNEWVSYKTDGNINDLLTDDIVSDPLLRVVIINAVYFKGAWRSKFDKRKTQQTPFLGAFGEETVQMMNTETKMQAVILKKGAAAVGLPYGVEGSDVDVRAVVYLPPMPTFSDEADMEGEPDEKMMGMAGAAEAAKVARSMTPAKWAKLSKQLSDPKNTRSVALSMPKFRLEYGATDVSSGLRVMGLKEAFEGSDGFLGMSDDRDLHLSKVIHKAVLEVNEEGTVATAATAATMNTRSVSLPLTINLDRPFLFFIEDVKSGALLFAGIVSSPGSKNA